MGLRKSIAKLLYKDDRPRSKQSEQKDLKFFIDLLKPTPISYNLLRIGASGDGGYLIPDDLSDVKYCFSPGVSKIAKFEEQLAEKYSIKSFLADASVDKPPVSNDFISFEPKFIGSRDEGDFIRLESWIKSKQEQIDDGDLLLQMDIEGYEYEVLIDTSVEALRRFRIMVIEFHALQMVFESSTLRLLTAIMEKVTREFAVVHIHPNNCKGVVERNGVAVPKVLEFTFLRKDRILAPKPTEQLVYPHPLDAKNLPSLPDVTLPDIWWRE
ncbi:MAG: FkbM family methyltransferase [Pseudomonadota bacterium]